MTINLNNLDLPVIRMTDVIVILENKLSNHTLPE